MKRLIILLLLILGTNTWAADLRIQGWSYPNVYEPSDTTELIFYGPNGTYNMPWSVLRDRIDSKLSASEVMLTAVSTEPAGANCTYGGQRLDIGLDDDADGLLDTEEIDATRYVCNGNPGTTGSDGADGLATLATVTAEPSGANCTNGGQRLDIGVDDDADGLLGGGEIDVTRYLCNGVDGATDWSQLSNVPPFGSASLVNTGNTAGDIPIFVACGTCSDQQYTTEATCTGAGGTWTLTGEVCLNVEIDIASLADAGGLISQTLSQLQCPDGQIPRSNGNGYVCSPDGTAATEIALSDITDWPSAVSAIEVGYLDGVTSGIQAQLNALSTGSLPHSETVPGADACNYNPSTHQIICNESGSYYASAAMTAYGDQVPSAFSFTDVTDGTTSTLYTSDAITVAGIDVPAPISISGNSGEYEINTSGSWLTADSTVSVNDTVKVRQTSSASNSTQTDTTLTIGGVSDIYSVTTAAGGSACDTSGSTSWVSGGNESFENGIFAINSSDITEDDTDGTFNYSATTYKSGSYSLEVTGDSDTASSNFMIGEISAGDTTVATSFWYYVPDLAGYKVSYPVIIENSSYTSHFRIRQRDWGSGEEIHLYDGTTYSTNYFTATPGQWYYISLNYNGTGTGNSELKVYGATEAAWLTNDGGVNDTITIAATSNDLFRIKFWDEYDDAAAVTWNIDDWRVDTAGGHITICGD